MSHGVASVIQIWDIVCPLLIGAQMTANATVTKPSVDNMVTASEKAGLVVTLISMDVDPQQGTPGASPRSRVNVKWIVPSNPIISVQIGRAHV